MSFRETLTEFWHTCGDRASWESGLTDRLAKTLTFEAAENDLCNADTEAFEASMINYGRRKAFLEMEANR